MFLYQDCTTLSPIGEAYLIPILKTINVNDDHISRKSHIQEINPYTIIDINIANCLFVVNDNINIIIID